MNGLNDFRSYFLLFSPSLSFSSPPSLLSSSSSQDKQFCAHAQTDRTKTKNQMKKKTKIITMTSDTTLFSGMYIHLYL